MSTVELRHIITEHLSRIEDASFLNALKTIIESKVSEGEYKLSDFQKKRIDSARNELFWIGNDSKDSISKILTFIE